MQNLIFCLSGLPGVESTKHTTDLLTGREFIAQSALIRLMRGPHDVGDIAPAHLRAEGWGAACAAACIRHRAQSLETGTPEQRAEVVRFYELADELAALDSDVYPKWADFIELQEGYAGVFSTPGGPVDEWGRPIDLRAALD